MPTDPCPCAGWTPFSQQRPRHPRQRQLGDQSGLAAAPTVALYLTSYQIPQIDVNYGLGERVQLTYEIPYVVQTSSGEPQHSGWSNATPGIKWRFLDQGERGWQMSTFPMIQTGVSTSAVRRGIASPGPRYFLPIEAAKKVGEYDLDLEAGCYFAER